MRRSLSFGLTCLLLGAAAARPDDSAPPRLLSHLPKDPLLAGIVQVGKLDQTLDQLIGFVQQFDPEMDVAKFEAELAEMEREVGCALRSDLLAQIGPEVAFVLDPPPIDGILAGFEDPDAAARRAFGTTGVFAMVRDGATLDRCLRQLAAHAELKTSEEDGLVRLEPQTESQPGAPVPPGVGFYYGVHDGVVALSGSPDFVRLAMRSRDAGGGLTDGSDFRRVFAHLDKNPRSLSYLNLPKARQLLESSGFLQAMISTNEEARPLLDLFLSPEVTGMGIGTTSVAIESGIRRTTYAPEALSGGIVSTGVVAAVLVPNLIEALDKAKRKRTMADMRALGVALEAVAVDRGAYPGPTDGWVAVEQIASSLEPDPLRLAPRTDGWGQPLLYWSDGVGYLLMSPGKDGVEDRDWLTAAAVEGEPGPGDAPDTDIAYSGGRFLIAAPESPE